MTDTEAKSERKPTKAKPWVVVEEARSWGPCLCERRENGQDEENHHKTVMVEARTWPGINKPGGVARITKRVLVEEEICGESVRLALFSVRYLLGGSEKEVRETYISCTPNDDGEARKTCPPELFTVPVEEPRPRRSKASEPCRAPQAPAGARSGSPLFGLPAPSSSSSSSSSAPTSRDCSKTVAKASVPASSRTTSTLTSSLSSCPSSSSSSSSSRRNNSARPPGCTSSSSSSSSSGIVASRENKLTKARVLGETGHNRSRGKGEATVAKKAIDHSSAARKNGCLSGPEGNGFKRKRDSPTIAATAIPVIPERVPTTVHRGDSESLEECDDDPGRASCPLDERRMSFIAEAVFKVFERAKTDKVSLPALKKGIEELLPDGMKSFEEAEQQAALKFLEDQENKIMVSGQEVYRI